MHDAYTRQRQAWIRREIQDFEEACAFAYTPVWAANLIALLVLVIFAWSCR